MPLVRHAAEAGATVVTVPAPLRRARVALTVIIAGVAVVGLLALVWPGPQTPSATASASAIAGPLRLASCRDWNAATGPQRLGTLRHLTHFSGGPVSGRTNARGPQLEDHQAYEMFERSCAPAYAGGFKLYKLYGRSAAFVGH